MIALGKIWLLSSFMALRVRLPSTYSPLPFYYLKDSIKSSMCTYCLESKSDNYAMHRNGALQVNVLGIIMAVYQSHLFPSEGKILTW